MTAAQKKAKSNFLKAIEYRKKTGVTLKEAFAHVYGKKVKAAKKLIVKKAKAKASTLKKAAIKKTKSGLKSRLIKLSKSKYLNGTKKPTEKQILKKVHSAKTTSKTLYNKLDKLDEAQHRHMGAVNKLALKDYTELLQKLQKAETYLKHHNLAIKNKKLLDSVRQQLKRQLPSLKKYIAELKKQKSELKKLL